MKIRRKFVQKILLIIGIILGFYLGIYIIDEPLCENVKKQSFVQVSQKEDTNFVIAGVMTARQYLWTRALASYNTWAKDIPGKVIYFSSEGSEAIAPPGLPVVGLKGVNDLYPPQKKSFLMLKYLHEFYGDQYQWFLRVDDDVYIKPRQLIELLSSLNSSKVYYIGQPGYGNAEEFGKLNLHNGDNYCMGGPGMVFSKATLDKMVPLTSQCLRNHLYSDHEDVEIGRCVNISTGAKCTASYDMSSFFYQNYQEPKGSFRKEVKKHDLRKALSLHPIKHPSQQYRMHEFFQKEQTILLRKKMILLNQEIHNMNRILNVFYNTSRVAVPWEGIGSKFACASWKNQNPYKKLEASFLEQLSKILLWVNYNIYEKYPKTGKGSIHSLKFLHGYMMIHPSKKAEYMVNKRLVFKADNKSYKSYVKQFRLSQTFTEIEFKEESGFGFTDIENQNLKIFNIEKNITFDFINTKIINFILTLSGRLDRFLTFLSDFEKSVLMNENQIVFILVLFEDSNLEAGSIKEIFYSYRDLYPHHSFICYELNGVFSRGVGLEYGANTLKDEDLIAFIDVDHMFTIESLQRFKANTVYGKQVYFPIMFSKYAPDVCKVQFCTGYTPFSNDDGYWRDSSYGPLVTYNRDFKNVGGFDKTIDGWGKEDILLCEAYIKAGITIFRSTEPGLTHRYHEITCDPMLEEKQLQMCMETKYKTYASSVNLLKIVLNNSEIII